MYYQIANPLYTQNNKDQEEEILQDKTKNNAKTNQQNFGQKY